MSRYAWLLLLIGLPALSHGALPFWPLPRDVDAGSGSLRVSPDFTVFCAPARHCNTSVFAAGAQRFIKGLRHGAETGRGSVSAAAPELRRCFVHLGASHSTPQPGADETYNLTVEASADGKRGDCAVHAHTVWGALHAFMTLLQATTGVTGDRAVTCVPLHVRDAPRFGYRGLLIDTARHFISVPSLFRLLDGMAANKLNVMHWHATDFESFPLRLTGYEALAERAAFHPRATYSPADVAAVVQHANMRGIRVVGEFDVPAHGAWGGSSSGATIPVSRKTLTDS